MAINYVTSCKDMGCGSGKLDHRPTIVLTGHRQLDGSTIVVHDKNLEDTDSLLGSEEEISQSSEKLQEYRKRYPELSKELRAMFSSVEKLRRLSETENAFSDKQLLSKINKEVLKLRKRSITAAFSAGTTDEKKYNVLANFIIDIDAAEFFHKLAEQLFDSYLNSGQTLRKNGVIPADNNPLNIETDRQDQLVSECLILILLVIQNFAEFHEQFCVTCARKTGIISLCLENSKLLESMLKTLDEQGSQRPVRVLGCCFNILYNMARKTEEVKPAVDFEAKETLLYFAKSDIPIVAPLALLSLAYVVDEESNQLIVAAEEILETLTSLLKKAYEFERRKFDGFSARELAEGLSHLAINDTNKKVLGEKGAIKVLVSMIKTSNDDKEKTSAVKALWMLAFDENNKKVITHEEGALDLLRELQRSEDPDVQKGAAGALWEIEGKTARNNAGETGKEVSGHHVMISYQWDAQEVLVEVKNKLQASGYRVWMDLEQMGGSTLEAMAKAVENASVVLVCVSQRYKESPNCRSEAEYAYQLRKDIIPLMVQRNYQPDGWLGMIVGTKLWIDFRNSYSIETGMAKLMKELGVRGRENDVIDGRLETTEQVQEDSIPVIPVVSGISSWTRHEVESWLKVIELDEVCKAVLPKLDGQALIYLHALREECPEYFYKCLESNLNLRDMFDVFKFREELSKLMNR
ncbi:hypothetical protein OS493_020519 [Desmophyllum pertusum]|uniref:TIR domain-containing protein n=1 Tax=Desmophyllum pertusum TaxID=174260 RepID=A0A9W9YZ57_9CNID|nr:hypothetical protein OS493_020519 [Desmophyllum pertusum]